MLREPLTSGMVGQTIHFEYSHDFDGLMITAVFTDGKNTVNIVNPGSECIIPHEVLTTVGAAVKVGIYATRGDELVIPTVYATIGIVLKGADPSGDVSIDPTLPVWAQTQAMIGNLNALETQAKENLVLAINEVKNTADGKQDAISDLEAIRAGAAKGATALQSVPNTYRTAAAQDVIDIGLSDRVSAIEGKEADWNSKYSKPTDGIPKTDLESAVQTSLDKADSALQSVPNTYRTASEQDTIDSGKVDKVTGKGLSSNDYTDAAKAKVDALAPVATSGNYNDLTNKPTIPTALPNPNALTFTGAVTGSYDGSEPLTVEIPSDGGSGSDISLGLTGAAAGQIAKIASVDENGAPTSWEATDLPSDGGSGGDDYITLNIRCDDSKIALTELQMPVIADKTVEEVMAEVNAGKKRMKIYMEGDPEPIIMNLSVTYPVLSFALLVGGEEFGE